MTEKKKGIYKRYHEDSTRSENNYNSLYKELKIFTIIFYLLGVIGMCIYASFGDIAVGVLSLYSMIISVISIILKESLYYSFLYFKK